MLVNVLIYKVYLYDNDLTIIFNTQNKPYNEKIPLIEELEVKLGACSYKERPAQPSPAQPICIFVELFKVFNEIKKVNKYHNISQLNRLYFFTLISIN